MVTLFETQFWYWAAQFWRYWEFQMRLQSALLEAMHGAPAVGGSPMLRLVVDNDAAMRRETRRPAVATR